jgi:hypothetical protein
MRTVNIEELFELRDRIEDSIANGKNIHLVEFFTLEELRILYF